MLLNNMESVVKIFFRGATVVKIAPDNNNHDVKGLNELETRGMVATRVRGDTKVKQYHAGQIFEYLKRNIPLQQN